MLSGQKSAEILERLLSDPDSFLENGELEDADWEPPRPGQLTSLGRDIRLLSAVASLRARLARAPKTLNGQDPAVAYILQLNHRASTAR